MTTICRRLRGQRFFSLALATAIVPLQLLATTPARAANECGALSGTGTVTCTPAGNNFVGGVTYSTGAAAGADVTLQTGVNVQSGANGGVMVTSTGAGPAVVEMQNGVAVNSTGNTGVKVTNSGTGNATVNLLGTGAGTVAISTGATGGAAVSMSSNGTTSFNDGSAGGNTVTTTNDNAAGFSLSSLATGTRNVLLSFFGTVTTGGAGAAAVSIQNTDNATVDVGTVSTAGANSNGVDLSVRAGSPGSVIGVTIENSVATAGANSNGINVSAPTGTTAAVTLDGAGSIHTQGDGSKGVAVSIADGSINSSIASVTTQGSAANAIDLQIAGSGNVTVGTLGTIVTAGADSKGVNAKTGTGNVTINAANATVLTGGAGIVASAGTGDVNINADGLTVGTTANAAPGVSAVAGAGNATIAGAGGSGAVASVNVNTAGNASAGLLAASSNGNASINVSGTVNTSGAGSNAIDASASGAATVASGATISASGPGSIGIKAVSTGDSASVDTRGGSVTASGANSTGILVAAFRQAVVTVGSLLTGGGVNAAGTGSVGVDVAATGGASTAAVTLNADVTGNAAGVRMSSTGGSTLTNNGTLQAVAGPAIEVTAGSAAIVNNKTLLGRVALAGSNTMTNAAAGTWQAAGTSSFGSGSNTFNNDGVLKTDAVTPGAANVALAGLTTFNNRATGTVTMANGREGDRISTSGNYAATSGARLAVDAFLGGPGSRADVLAVGGNVAGQTVVAVNDTNSGPGRYNPQGITVVTVGGTSLNNAFYLPGGPINKGLFAYDLVKVGNTFALVTPAAAEVAALPSVVSQAKRYWQVGENAFDDHRASMRAAIAGDASPSGASPAPLAYANDGSIWDRLDVKWPGTARSASPGNDSAVWLQAIGATFDERLGSQAAFGSGIYSYNTDVTQNIGRLVGGYDMVFGGLAPGDAINFGVKAGYGTSSGKMSSAASAGLAGGSSSADLAAYTAGLYAQYLTGPWWAGLSASYDRLDGTYRIDRVGLSKDLKGSTWGGTADAGWTVRFGRGSVEPYAALTYSQVRFDDIETIYGRAAFGTQNSFDGKLGVRSRMPVWTWGDWDVTALANAAIVHGFIRPSAVSFDGFTIPGASSPDWGSIGGGVEVGQRAGGLAGYIKGDWMVSSGLTGGTLQGGMRYRF